MHRYHAVVAGNTHRVKSSAILMLTMVVLLMAACGSSEDNAPVRSIAPNAQTSVPSPAVASATALPSLSAPSTSAPSASLDIAAGEAYLRAGIRPDATTDCAPRREDLPARAIAGVECRGDQPAVERVGFYLFASEADLLATYFERLDAEGIGVASGGCFGGEEGEGSYHPEEFEGTGPNRDGCFINDAGRANYRATLSDALVYMGVLGASGDIQALYKWAWLGNLDTPGGPTIWRGGPG